MNLQPLTKGDIFPLFKKGEEMTGQPVKEVFEIENVRDALLLLKKEQARILFDIQPKIRTGDIIDILVAIDEAFPAFAEDTTIDKSHDANCEGSMCYCKSRRQKKGAE